MVSEQLPMFFTTTTDNAEELGAEKGHKLSENSLRKDLNIANPYWYFKPYGLKKSTFSKFLDDSGISAHITRVLSDIYDTEEKPPYPVHYFRKHFGYFDPETPNVEFLIEFLQEKREELIKLREQNKHLKQILAQYSDVDLVPLEFRPIKRVEVSSTPESHTDELTFWSSTTTEEVDLEKPIKGTPKKKREIESSTTSSEKDVLAAYETIEQLEKQKKPMQMLHK